MTPIRDEAAVEALLALPQAWLLKHSNACPISFAAHDEVAAWLAAHPGQTIGLVVVQESRPLCAWIAKRLGHAHQSPQLFLLRGGKVAWTASHWSITRAAMDAQ